MTASTKTDILNARRALVQFLGLEAFGLVLFCGPISEKESADLEASCWKPGTTEVCPVRIKASRRNLIAMTVCDEEGNRLLTEEEAGQLDSRLAETLFKQADAFVKAEKPKNSQAGGDDSPPSGSPSNADEPTSTPSSTKSAPASSPSGKPTSRSSPGGL